MCLIRGARRRRRAGTTKTAAVCQAELGVEAGAGDGEFAGEQPEGREAEQPDDREREAAAEHRSTGQEAAQLGDAARAFDEWQLTRRRGTPPIYRARAATTCSKQRGDCEGGADRGGERDDAHVFDARVCEEPFGVSLADHERRGNPQRQERRGDEQTA